MASLTHVIGATASGARHLLITSFFGAYDGITEVEEDDGDYTTVGRTGDTIGGATGGLGGIE